jgi:hypothetical protein
MNLYVTPRLGKKTFQVRRLRSCYFQANPLAHNVVKLYPTFKIECQQISGGQNA